MKLRRKLLSAGFALGATALTLTTSTFAWYTTNTEVTIDTMSGITSTAADSDSLFVNPAQTYEGKKGSTWGQYTSKGTPVLTSSAVLDTVAEPTTSTATQTVLTPVYFNTSDLSLKRIKSVSGSTVTYATAETKTDYMEFVLRFRLAEAGTSVPVYFSNIELTNTASASDASQTALAYGNSVNGYDTGITGKGSYFADLRKALKLAVVSYDMTSSESAQTTASTTNVFGFESFVPSTDSNKDVNITSGQAVGYYNAVMKTSMSTPSTNYSAGQEVSVVSAGDAVASTVVTAFTIPSTGYAEVYFVLYLDGWDNYCYDVMRKQNVTVNLEFTTDIQNATIIKTPTE